MGRRWWAHRGRIALHLFVSLLVLALLPSSPGVAADDKFLAPGFTALPADSLLLVAPLDVELFEVGAGGVTEPRADWTAAAERHMTTALGAFGKRLGARLAHLSEEEADRFAEALSLHAAVAQSIALHHGVGGIWALPTKEGRLDWTFGDTFRELQARSGADHALFTWVRDTYASAGRKAMIFVLAVAGIGVGGGAQVGYATLVDLRTGRVLWFNHLARLTGDLREEEPAAASVQDLLQGFPPVSGK